MPLASHWTAFSSRYKREREEEERGRYLHVDKWSLPFQSTDGQWKVHPTGIADNGSNLIYKASRRERGRERERMREIETI